jgi:acetyl-CoA synthetase
MRTVYGDHQRFFDTYFSAYPGKYFTSDGCRRDEDGYYWITGRVDDVINVSGHRLGTAEIESALVGHQAVAEAAVVGIPHDVKGQSIYAYVTLKSETSPSAALKAELVKWVRHEIGPFAAPDGLQFAPGLPKTRSGKIMRRILRKVAENDLSNLGDTTTLADPSVVDDLVAGRAGTLPASETLELEGHKVSAGDLERALIAHLDVVDAAIIGVPKAGGGQEIYAFVRLLGDVKATDVLEADLKGWMRREVGAYAAPRTVQFVPAFPYDRSGVIARDVLRSIAAGKGAGDVSGVTNPGVLDDLVKNAVA